MNSYLKLCTALYDIDKPQAPVEALAFYRRCAQAARGPILEPRCGSGRFLVPLRESGFEVDGIDASPQMLGACRTRCQERGLSPTLYQQYLHQLDVPRQYGLIFIAAGSFSLLIDPDEIRLSLQKLRAALLPAGKLVLEVERLKADQRSHDWPWCAGKWVERPDRARIISSWMGRYDAERRISYSKGRYDLVKDEQVLETEVEDFNLRFYSADEFSTVLHAAGFEGVKLLDDYGKGTSEPGEDTFLFEARVASD